MPDAVQRDAVHIRHLDVDIIALSMNSVKLRDRDFGVIGRYCIASTSGGWHGPLMTRLQLTLCLERLSGLKSFMLSHKRHRKGNNVPMLKPMIKPVSG